MELKAAWKEVYTVEFDSDGGSEVEPQTVADGDYAAKPVPPVKEGYGFDKWLLDGEEYDFETPVTEDITLKATWSQTFYTVAFDSDGGSEVAEQTVAHGGYAVKPEDPTKEGYAFDQWLLDDEIYDFETPVTDPMELKATWKEVYTVAFDSDGGSEVDSQTVAEGEAATKPKAPTKEGYAFDKWLLNDEEYDFETPVTENITLTAAWDPNDYTVRFNSDGGSRTEAQTVAYGDYAAMPEKPTKEGYTFDEWQLDGNAYDFEKTPVTGDLTLTAKWTINEYRLTFDPGEGNEMADNAETVVVKPYREAYRIEETAVNGEEGREFIGWYDAETGGNRVTVWDANADLTVYARYTELQMFTIRLNLNGQGELSPQEIGRMPGVVSVDGGDQEFVIRYIGALTLPVPADVETGNAVYTFLGWQAQGEPEAKISVQIEGRDAAYTAVWQEGKLEGKVGLSGTEDSKIQGLAGQENSSEVSTDDDANQNTPAQQLAQALKEIAAQQGEEGDITIEMSIAVQQIDQEDPTQEKFREEAEHGLPEDVKTSLEYLKVTLTKTVAGDDPEELSNLGQVVDIPLRYDLTGAYNPAVYWQRNNAAAVMTQLTSKPASVENAPEGSFYVEGEGANAVIHLYTRQAGDYSIVTQDTQTYTVTFDTAGGTPIPAQQKTTGLVARPENNPARSGYRFLNWNASATEAAVFDFDQPVNADTTIYARWSRVSSGGSSSSSTAYYPVTVNKSENGTVTASVQNASTGMKITLTLKADEGYEAGDVTVKNSAGNAVSITENQDGTFSYWQVIGGTTATAVFTRKEEAVDPGTDDHSGDETPDDHSGDEQPDDHSGDHGSNADGSLEESELAFTDVAKGRYFYAAVAWAVENDVTQGKTANTFDPDGFCTRGQTVAFLWRAAGRPEPVSAEMPFTDVAESAYYYKAVLWAVEQGITKGVTETEFQPYATVTRSQVVTFLFRSTKLGSWNGREIFTDVLPGSYYYDAVTWASDTGVTQGRTETTFEPKLPCTRAQIVTFLYRYYVKPDNA